jgi:RimJ/RimL family protein N-acetyltransferase
MEHGRVQTLTGLAGLRDLSESDIDFVVNYWHDSSDEHLDCFGIDRTLLGSRTDTYARIDRALRSADPDQPNIAFAITLDGKFVGYTLLNRYEPQTNYSHWHITDARRRAAGLSTALYPHRIKTYFDTTSIERLIHQTRTRNVGVNRMLDKYVPVAETAFIERPDGVAEPGEFCIRYVHRTDVPRLFEIATHLMNA